MNGKPTNNGVRPGSRRGSLKTLLSLSQCHAAFSAIPSNLAWVDQSPLASMCRSKPHQGMPSTTVTGSHVTQGKVENEPTISRGMEERLGLWEALGSIRALFDSEIFSEWLISLR